jgi:hypothetical protein
LPERVVTGPLWADLKNQLAVARAIPQFQSLLHGARHGLFHVHVLARVQGVEGHLRVPVIGSGDHQRVHVLALEDLAVIRVPFGRGKPRGAIQPPPEHVAHGDAADVIRLGALDESFQVEGTPGPQPDAGDVDASVAALRARVVSGAEC